MNLYSIKAAAYPGSVEHSRVCHMRTQQGPWTARILMSRNEAEGGHFERLWLMPSTVWHLLVSNQDRPGCQLQFKGTFYQV